MIPFMVMELISRTRPGRRVDGAARMQQAADLEFGLWVAEQVAEALAAAHDREIVHRDPRGNVMLTNGKSR